MFALPSSQRKAAALVVAAASYITVGIAHFTHADFFVSIMPPWLPLHLELVWISGFFEILGGVGLLIPRLRRMSSWGLIMLLIAVYPANLHMAFNPEPFIAEGMPLWGLYLRLPFQFLFIAWAWWVGLPEPPAHAVAEQLPSHEH